MEKAAPLRADSDEISLPELIQAELWFDGQFSGACGLRMIPSAGGTPPRLEALGHVASCPECRRAVESLEEDTREAVTAFEIVSAW